MGVNLKIGTMADMLALGAERRKRWRMRHEEFLQVVLRARAAKRAELGEKSVTIEPLPTEVTQAGLVLCEKCGRRFSEGVFEKHKDVCKEVRDLQETELTEEQKDAKARFLKRMAYSGQVCGRTSQQESTEEKEAPTAGAGTEPYPSLSCAAEMQKMQSLLKNLIPSLSNVQEKLQQSDSFNQLLQQLLSTGLPPPRDEALLQISNCNKTVMPNCDLIYAPENDSRSASQSLCGRINPRDDNFVKFSSPSAVSSVSSLSTFSLPLDSASECSQKGSLEDEIKQKAEGTSKPSQCLSGVVSSAPSTIEPKFLTDCASSKAVSGGCVRKHGTTDSSKVGTATTITDATAPASGGDSYGTSSNIRSNAELNTRLTTWKAKQQRTRPHGQPKLHNYVKNNCKFSSGADIGFAGSLPSGCASSSTIPVSADTSEAKNTSTSERHHHCHRHHQHRHHQRHGHSGVTLIDGHQSQKNYQSGSSCAVAPSLTANQDPAASKSKGCVRPTDYCSPPQVEICLKEAQEVPQSPLSRSNPGSSPVFYQFVKTMEAGDRDSGSRFQEEIEKPIQLGSRCGSTSTASVSFMSAVTSNTQYRSVKASDQFQQQSTAASPASSLVYLDVEGTPSAEASIHCGNMLKPSAYSSDTCFQPGTHLTPEDLWRKPAEVAALLRLQTAPSLDSGGDS